LRQKKRDPEDVELLNQTSISNDSELDMSLCQSYGYSLGEIGKVLKYPEFSITLLFFWIQGILVPNFDDIHYIFITQAAGMPLYKYDFLNTISYGSLILFVLIYNKFLTQVEAYIMVIFSLVLFLLMTILMLANAVRWNIDHGISDETINGFIFFFGTQTNSTLAILTITVLLTYLVP
jgi:hypothetical protein